MTVKSWTVILVIEIMLIGLVILIFKTFDLQIAGLFAGFFFGLLGLGIGFQLLRTNTLKSLTFWWLFVYMFYSVIPMVFNRMNEWGRDFSQVKIWGIEGREFHKVSEKIYGVLIIATAIDLIWTWYNQRKITPAEPRH